MHCEPTGSRQRLGSRRSAHRAYSEYRAHSTHSARIAGVLAGAWLATGCQGAEVETGSVPILNPDGHAGGGGIGGVADAGGGGDTTPTKGFCLASADCALLAAGKACVAAFCDPASHQCATKPAAAGAACASGDPCVATAACDALQVCQPVSAIACDDGVACTTDDCASGSGCTHGVGSDGTVCDDGYACTGKDACLGGLCVGSAGCDDGDPCTADLCAAGQPGAPCTYNPLPDFALCDDGNACSVSTQCSGGKCKGGFLIDCDDGNACTQDSCDGSTWAARTPTGPCQHGAFGPAAACSDGNPCTQGDHCEGQACKGAAGACACSKPADCADDANLCNGVPQCVNGQCLPDPASVVACPAASGPCVTAVCVPGTGTCTEKAIVPAAGEKVPCSDGNACTVGDACVTGGKCSGGAAPVCADGNPCTQDSCDPATGCQNVPWPASAAIPCNDDNVCTFGDQCSAGACVPGKNACQCQATADCAAGDDSNPCNGGLQCVKGACVPDGKGVTCPVTGDSCTMNTCDPKSTLCVASVLPDGQTCGSSTACTSGGQCKAGACQGAAATTCDDANPCTKDACTAQGCSHIAVVGTPCDDANPCTAGDACSVGGTCGGGANTCGCQTDADCAKQDDGNFCNGVLACQAGQCVPKAGSVVTCPVTGNGPCATNTCQPSTGQCKVVLKIAGAACSDSDACTFGDVCAGGKCGGVVGNCIDGNLCTDDGCNPASGCYHTPSVTPCDDGNPCTQGDQCKDTKCVSGAGTCACQADADCKDDGDLCNGVLVCVGGQCAGKPGSAVVCDAALGGLCAANLCDAKKGTCGLVSFPTGTACNDGTVCTAFDACDGAGACAGKAVVCDDKNPCTVEACNKLAGCVAKNADGVPCDDGEACTQGDVCKGGGCAPGVSSCACKVDADCKDDGDACNGVPVCQANQCVPKPGSAVVCDAACVTTDAAGGKKAKPDGTACDDANACTSGSVCTAGKCGGGSGVVCADTSLCTNDACDVANGCVFTPNTNACDDGSVCTQGDTCAAGQCAPGKYVCAVCVTAADCKDDGDKCNGVPACVNGACLPGPAIECTVANGPCQSVGCNGSTGQCVAVLQPNGAPCDDANACTGAGQCVSGVCLANPVSCDDKNPCTQDSCDTKNGCSSKGLPTLPPTTCDDGDPCTGFSACIGGKCQGFANQCACQTDANCKDDANKCNGVPACIANKCQAKPGTVVVCDASGDTPCLKNQCLAALGQCLPTPAAPGTTCNDKSLCSASDVCAAGQCIGLPLNCQDTVACTLDACDPALGCVHTADAKACDDGKPCTTDACDKTAGCLHGAASGPACDDGDPCTTGDACVAGTCKGAGAKACDDANPCTLDACTAGVGCTTKPQDGAACNDGSGCTTGDKCGGGACQGAPVVCDDKNVCTQDACDPATGACGGKPAPGTACEDGNACTTSDTCLVNGACFGAPKNCDDGNLCTQDSCDKGSGQCANAPFPGQCNDGNGCTTDACNPKTGACASTPTAGAACTDGSACTAGDACSAGGTCVGAAVVCDDGKACTTDTCVPASGCKFVAVPTYAANFDNGTMGGIVGQATNNQIAWTIDKTQFASAPAALYVGNINPFTGKHSYNVGPGVANAQLPVVTIPDGVTNATLSLHLRFERDPAETSPPGCSGLTDTFSVLVGGQPRATKCSSTKGFEAISVALTSEVGKPVQVTFTFLHNFQNNNGGGIWVDNVKIDWVCP
ncbi:MAG: hypothetical protein EXR79_06170 [Myxococcales bacterium]|nr:hypothetical protein [Myxococcales bacterium]